MILSLTFGISQFCPEFSDLRHKELGLDLAVLLLPISVLVNVHIRLRVRISIAQPGGIVTQIT